MTEKELRHLNRRELLELLVQMSRQNEQLKAQLAEAGKQAENRRIAVEESGSLAEAALQLNHIFEDAQQAADDYLAEIKARTETEEKPKKKKKATAKKG